MLESHTNMLIGVLLIVVHVIIYKYNNKMLMVKQLFPDPKGPISMD